MKSFNLIFTAIIFLLFCNPTFADVFEHPATLNNISNQIPKMGSIQCKYKQEKYLQNISKPIVSAGDFKFVENEGVYFYATYPIKSTVDYTNKNYKEINDIVRAISTKKFSRLEKEFDFFYTNKSNQWTLGMKPKKSSAAANYISSITISGEDYIRQINIKQTNGNKTAIWFTK